MYTYIYIYIYKYIYIYLYICSWVIISVYTLCTRSLAVISTLARLSFSLPRPLSLSFSHTCFLASSSDLSRDHSRMSHTHSLNGTND